jgi:hypothetical protein
MKEIQRPRNVFTDVVKISFGGAITRVINNPQQKGMAIWTSPFGKKIL